MRLTLAQGFSLPDQLSPDYLAANGVLPLSAADGKLLLAASRQPRSFVIDDMIRLFRLPVELLPVEDGELQDAIRRTKASSESILEVVRDLAADGGSGGETGIAADLRDLANQPPVIRFVNLLIREAHGQRASDVHLDTGADGLTVRYRVDGVLSDVSASPAAMHEAVISRLKLLAGLDIAERRLPQDGRFRVRLEERELDIRLATMPTHFGESAVLRLLDRGGRPVGLDDLGMAAETRDVFQALARRPNGIVLATGPTGSGKTSTLYAALALRDRTAEKVLTVEDPVEYELPGVTQVAVSERSGLTFARALRGLVRHDPDVLMIGETRDEETADIAVRAAMTGHLVFSTLHTNDALGAIPRLRDLGVAPYLIAATVEAVLAQRLVRRICQDCRQQYRADGATAGLLARRPVGRPVLWRGRGCSTCRGTGYRGRIGLFELLVMSDPLKDLINRNAELQRLKETTSDLRTLRDDGWAKVEAGVTTLEEVLRVVQT